MSNTPLEGKVAIVTGAGRGLGKSEALALARQGARVVITEIKQAGDFAQQVADEIRQDGGEAIVALGDVGDYNDCKATFQKAVDTWGDVNIIVNNAGFCIDKMLFNMGEQDFDPVVRVHLKGHFNYISQASAYWRAQSKAQGGPVYGRLISTASEAFLYCPPGQPNYAPAKAGITVLTMCAAQATARYGVTANVILPRARTDMTKAIFGESSGDGFDELSPDNVSPLAAYLASPMAGNINGYVLLVYGKMVQIIESPRFGEKFESDAPWTVEGLHDQLAPFFEKRKPVVDGYMVMPPIPEKPE